MAFAADSPQSDTQYLPVSSSAPTKDGESYEEREVEWKGWRGGRGEELINE